MEPTQIITMLFCVVLFLLISLWVAVRRLKKKPFILAMFEARGGV